MAEKRVIHKFRGGVPGFELDLPDGSLILKVADQTGAGETLSVWVEVPAEEVPAEEVHAMVRRSVKVVPTGVEFDQAMLEGYGHIDSIVTAGGALVWHVYLDRDGERWVVAPEDGAA